MFTKTIDNKPTTVDANGRTIVDLTKSIFNQDAGQISSYEVKRMNEYFEMRPDKASLSQYNDVQGTEYILKYTGISNPFSLAKDDILMIPDEDAADTQTQGTEIRTSTETTSEAQIRNFYKFVNKDYTQNTDSYKALENLSIPSGVPSSDFNGDYIVPYISEDGNAAVTIKNGRMYFGTDSGFNISDVLTASTTNVDEKIQAIIDSTATAMSDSNCMYNGSSLANFVRATVVDNLTGGQNS